MLNVENLNPVEYTYTDGGMTILDLPKLHYIEEEPYDLFDTKAFDKFISDVERVIRNSFEYRQLIEYLKKAEGMNECALLDNVVSTPGSTIKIEIHHSPLTLYDICVTVFRKRVANNESLNINDIAEEVMYLHYIGWVGLIPLSLTGHEATHNGYTFIPTDVVRGNFRMFIRTYYNYINPEILDAIDAADQATKDNIAQQRLELFNNHKLYVNIDGSYHMPSKDKTSTDIRTRISDIKNNKKSLRNMCNII